MKPSLQQRCDLMIANDEAMRKMGKLEATEMQCLGSLLYTARGRTADPAHMKACREILRKKVGVFSEFRGTMELAVLVKMSLADDPEQYFDDLHAVYEKVVEGKKIRLTQHALAAIVIHDHCPVEKLDQVIDETKKLYSAIRETHPFLTDASDMAFIALMVMSGKSAAAAAVDAEECYELLKERYRIGSDAAQSVAQILALSSKTPDEKVTKFLSLYEALKAAKHNTDKGRAISIFAAFVDVDAPQEEIVSEIGEVDVWLKPHRGYGAFGVGSSFRRMIAAALVVEDYQAAGAVATDATGISAAVAQVVAEELVLLFILIMISTTTVIATSN